MDVPPTVFVLHLANSSDCNWDAVSAHRTRAGAEAELARRVTEANDILPGASLGERIESSIEEWTVGE